MIMNHIKMPPVVFRPKIICRPEKRFLSCSTNKIPRGRRSQRPKFFKGKKLAELEF